MVTEDERVLFDHRYEIERIGFSDIVVAALSSTHRHEIENSLWPTDSEDQGTLPLSYSLPLSPTLFTKIFSPSKA